MTLSFFFTNLHRETLISQSLKKSVIRSPCTLLVRLIAEELGISKDTAHTIVRDDLGKQMIYSQFMPRKLTNERKEKWMETSGDLISMCDQDPLLLENIVTGNQNGNQWCGVH